MSGDFDYTRDVFQPIERRMIEHARPDLARPAPPPTFDEAWRVAVAELPKGWTIDRVYRRPHYWSAWAKNTNPPVGVGLPGLRGDSPRDADDPIGALVALAKELHDYRTTSPWAEPRK